MSHAVLLERLRKVFRVSERAPGLSGSLRALFRPRYQEVVAVDDVSFAIAPGERVAFVGPNGAGKSTTLKILSGILEPTSGTARVLGLEPARERARLGFRIGAVFGQRSQLWQHLPAADTFDLLAKIYELEPGEYASRRAELVAAFDIGAIAEKPVRQLSLGERMRCELVASLLHRPEILFLDEPTIGLDVAMQRRIRSFIAEYNARPGRDTDACRGVLSFDQAFEESYTRGTVRWLPADQRRRLLLPAENVLAHRQNGQIALFDNVYYDSRLAEHAGRRLTVRFDPADLHGSVHVFEPGGPYICEARCEAPVGFMDMIGVKTDQRLTRRLRKNVRESARISVDIEVNDLRKKLPLYPVEGGDSSRPAPGVKELVIPRKRSAAGGAGRLWTAEEEHAAFTAGMADLNSPPEDEAV